jgi:predicted amino acid racemase
MVETGDFREGFLMEEIPDTMKAARKFSNIRTIGFGTNTTCLNRSVPSQKQITEIVELTERYVGREGVPSPGNSGALYLFIKDKLAAFRGKLRIGEAILLGNETVEYRKLDFLRDDAFELETSIIEARRKRYDKIQLIAALGKADIGEGKIFPKIRGLKEIRRSSDHTVLVVERAFEEEVMAVLKKNSFTVRFKPDYFALLHSFASPLVNKNYF